MAETANVRTPPRSAHSRISIIDSLTGHYENDPRKNNGETRTLSAHSRGGEMTEIATSGAGGDRGSQDSAALRA